MAEIPVVELVLKGVIESQRIKIDSVDHTNVTEFNPPRKIQDLRSARMWDIAWSQETFPTDEFEYWILEKLEDGGYNVHAVEPTPDAAFGLRRQLAERTGKKLFIRAKRVQPVITVGPRDAEASEDCDLWRDAWKTGNDHLVPEHQQADYKVWAAKRTQNVYARFGGGPR